MDQYYYSLYGALALSHLAMQVIFAQRNYINQQKALDLCTVLNVGIIIPVFNEKPEILKKAIYAALATRCSGKRIVVVDDGSTNIEELNWIYKEVEQAGVIVAKSSENVGKRMAQKIGFDLLSGDVDIVVTIDSDTMIAPDGVQEILLPFLDPKIGAVTGHVMVENERKNVLTRLISCRYWNAFNQERAAQSLFGVVTCCSGPFSAYREEIIRKVKKSYVSQTFLGKPCTYGDDRHLTNLVLKEGYKIVYQQSASSYTYVPESLKVYMKQQVRWGRSFFREMIWTFKTLRQHHPYMTYDIIMQICLPFMLIFALVAAVINSFTNPYAILHYVLFVLGISFLRSIYAIGRTKKSIYWAFSFYGLLYVVLLVPVKIYALSTMTTKGWGTR